MEIKISNLEEEIVEKLDLLAKKKNISREELLYNYVMNISNQKEIFNTFSKYENLLNIVEKSINDNTKVLKEY